MTWGRETSIQNWGGAVLVGLNLVCWLMFAPTRATLEQVHAEWRSVLTPEDPYYFAPTSDDVSNTEPSYLGFEAIIVDPTSDTVLEYQRFGHPSANNLEGDFRDWCQTSNPGFYRGVVWRPMRIQGFLGPVADEGLAALGLPPISTGKSGCYVGLAGPEIVQASASSFHAEVRSPTDSEVYIRLRSLGGWMRATSLETSAQGGLEVRSRGLVSPPYQVRSCVGGKGVVVGLGREREEGWSSVLRPRVDYFPPSPPEKSSVIEARIVSGTSEASFSVRIGDGTPTLENLDPSTYWSRTFSAPEESGRSLVSLFVPQESADRIRFRIREGR